MGGATLGWAVLGSIRKQTEKANRQNSSMDFASVSALSSCSIFPSSPYMTIRLHKYFSPQVFLTDSV